MISNKDENKKNRFFSVDLFKIFLTFLVVICHFWLPSDNGNIFSYGVDNLRKLAVPCFFSLSFYLLGDKIPDYSLYQFITRKRRLMIPFYFWGVFSWIMAILFNYASMNKDSIAYSIVWQLFTGSREDINPTLWYLFILSICTSLFFYLYKLPLKNFNILLVFIVVFSFFIQYSGLNYWLFNNLGYEIKYSIGRLFEMIPYACVGIFVKLTSERRKKSKKIFFLVSILLVCIYFLLENYSLLKIDEKGFGYQGVDVLVGTLGLVFLFLSFEIFSDKLRKVIYVASKHTLGIYCIHYLVGNLLKRFIDYGILLCIVIYVLCYLICELAINYIGRYQRINMLFD